MKDLTSCRNDLSLADLNTTSGTESLLDVVVDGELEGGEGTDHDDTGTQAQEETLDTELTSQADEAGHDGASAGGLVDLGKEGIGGLGDDGSGHTGDQTGAQVDGGQGTGREVLLGAERSEDGLGGTLEDDELGHGVGDLLEQDGAESRVETAEGTVLLQDTGETTDKTGGEGGLGNETNAGGLKGAEGNIGKELGNTGGDEVDGSAVVDGVLLTNSLNDGLLPELVTTELEGTLQEVTSEGGAESGQESASTLSLDDLTESSAHTLVVDGGLELDASLDDIDGGEGTVGDTAADGTSQGEAGVEVSAGGGDDSGLLGGHDDV